VTTLGLVILLSLVVGSLTAAATSVRFVSRIWLRYWTERRLSGEHIASLLLERPQRLLIVAGTGIASAAFAMGAIIGLRDDGNLLLRDLLFAALLLLTVGQALPRAVARRWTRPLMPVLVPVLHALDWLCSPLVDFAGRLVRPARSRVGLSVPGERDALEDLLREGEIEGVGEPSESAIITGVAEFGTKRAADVMTPRAGIIGVERTAPAAQISWLVVQSKFSRIPVFEGGLDHSVGLVHSFDVLAHPDAPLTALRKVATARADTPCPELMRRMLRDRVHLAIIQDSAGLTVGLVSLEDLVEELVGEISDEHDEPVPGGG
jgi:putative hemolysin